MGFELGDRKAWVQSPGGLRKSILSTKKGRRDRRHRVRRPRQKRSQLKELWSRSKRGVCHKFDHFPLFPQIKIVYDLSGISYNSPIRKSK